MTLSELQHDLERSDPRLARHRRLVRRDLAWLLQSWPAAGNEETVRRAMVDEVRQTYRSVWLWFALQVALLVVEALIRWWLSDPRVRGATLQRLRGESHVTQTPDAR
jgi:hypothetical protein